jgi:tetratricopeptide (TPR) repeat protein
MQPPSVSTDCYALPEIVDDAMGELASLGGDVRAAVAEARRVAELMRGQGSALEAAPLRGPAWRVEPDSLTEAVYWYRQAAGLGDAPGPAEVAASLSNLGYAWRGQRRWAEAETAFRESLQLRQQHGDRGGMGQTYFDLGTLYAAQEHWADAEQALLQSLEIARETGDRRGEAQGLRHLGVVCAAQGQAEKAAGYFQQAVAIARASGDEAFARRILEHQARLSQC